MFYEPLVVNNIPYRAFTGPCRSRRLHWHSEIELLICLEGRLQVYTESRLYLLKPGEAIVLPGFESHAVSPMEPNTRRIAIAFGYSLLGSEFSAIHCTCLQIPAGESQPETLRYCIRTISRCLTEKSCVCPENEWQIRGCLCLLAGYMRTLPAPNVTTEDLQSRIRRQESIYAVLDHVAEHYREAISVEEAADIAGYAATYFCKQFKSITGFPFHRYLTRYRVSMACIFLEDPGLLIGTVAEMTGFSSLKLFCRTFKEVTGITPSQYQALQPEEKHSNWLI